MTAAASLLKEPVLKKDKAPALARRVETGVAPGTANTSAPDDRLFPDEVSAPSDSASGPAIWRPNAFLQATIDALSAHLAILDEAGIVRAVNAGWRRGLNGAADARDGIGERYIDLCRRVCGEPTEAAAVERGLDSVLSGTRRQFTHVCVMGGGGARWLQIRIGAFSAFGARRAVVAHEDVTDVRRIDQELRRVTGQLLDIQEAERRRIARDLHDSTANNLYALRINLDNITRCMESRPDAPRAALTEMRNALAETEREIRVMSYLLHPPKLGQGGLAHALQDLAAGVAQRTGLTINVTAPETPSFERPEVEIALLRIAQESLTNVHRHAKAKRVELRLTTKRGLVMLEIEDDGVGLGESGRWKDGAPLGVGVPGMQARVTQLGGALEIRSGLTGGTLVRACLPLARSGRVRTASEEALSAPEAST